MMTVRPASFDLKGCRRVGSARPEARLALLDMPHYRGIGPVAYQS